MTTIAAGGSPSTSYAAVNDGNWSDPETWESGQVPTDGSGVVIADGTTVTIAAQITTRVKYLNVAGTLRHAPDTDTKLRVETLETQPGSRYEIGTASTPIRRNVTAEVEVIDEGPIDESIWPDRKNKGLMLRGDIEIVGAEKTPWSTLAQAPTAGDASIELSAEPAHWSPGDTVVVPGTEPYESTSLDHKDEKRTISSITGATVTFESPLDYDHTTPKSGLDTYALNLSRNIVVYSENTVEHRRGHIMIMSPGSDVRHVRLRELGRTNKDEYLTNPVRGKETLPKQDDPNPAARYPFHYHHTGIEAEPHRAEGLVIQGSPGWGFVNHHAHAEVADSITYDVLGAGFVSEGGNERGSFDNCIAIRSKGSGETIDSRSAGAHGGDPAIDDFGHAGHGFWMQSPLVEVTNCVAGGHRHQAFVWWLRPLLDGHLAEGTSVADSRVTYHPNLPMKYLDGQEPLLEAIKQQRFSTDAADQVMWETQKIPSTFANIRKIRGNVAFGSAGGADFSRHNFKWKHERFSEFSTIEDMTVHSIGAFIDNDGAVHEPDLPKHLASGHQGRGGNVGVSFRYASNVSLADSNLIGNGQENSVAVPWHDYLWTNTVDRSTIENWDWGVSSGEHRLTWVRDNTFRNNSYDVEWNFDTVGPTILEDNDLNLVRHKFQRINQKATEVFYFNQNYGIRIDGRSVHVEASHPDYVPFPDEKSLGGVNHLNDVFPDPQTIVGMTNAELMDEHGVAISGALLPDDAVGESYIEGSLLDPAESRNPATSVYLDSTAADSLGMFEVVSDPDATGGECLRCTGSDSPQDNPALISFDCAAGTYSIHGRIRPDAWNGDSVYYRIDGGTWQEAEKIKTPIGFEWHAASPNGGEPYEWELSEGRHTLEFACGNGGVRLDEIFVGSDQEVLGAYGMSQQGDSNITPVVKNLSMSEVETNNADAEFDASWSVSDDDGDLSSVELILTEDGAGRTEDSATLSVSGSSASGTTRLVATGDEGTGNSYTIEATVTDSSGRMAATTASATESETVPIFDTLSLSEVETDTADAAFDASWAVTDNDSDLDSVDLTLTDDTNGETEESVSLPVSGDSATDTTRLAAAGDGGIGNSYTVAATVTDSFENTDSATASATAELENKSPPTVDGITLSEVETDDPDAAFDASWSVSDSDGNLASVDLLLTDDTDGGSEASTSLSIGGDTASGTTRLVAAGDEGSGNDYTVAVTVTDAFGETDSATAAAGERENAPSVDAFAVSEVETDSSDAAFDVSWDTSDDDGDLRSLDLVLTQDSADAPEDSVTLSISGTSASETTRLVAAGDDGSANTYTVEATITDSFDNTESATDVVQEGEPDVQAPYTDHDLSQIEAEAFDTGGEGVAYHDTNEGNKGDAYRDTDVDIQTADDTSGGYNIAWIRDGEWWEYTVDVPADGEYALTVRVAGKNATSLDVAASGSQLATVEVPNTGGWQEWTTVDAGVVNLSAGTHTIRLTANGSDFNFNWFGFEPLDTEAGTQSPYTDHDLSQIEAEDFDTGGEGVAYHDTNRGNHGNAYRDTDVDIQIADDTSGDYNIAWIRDGEWWEYTVDVPADGEYDLTARVAGKNATSLDLAVDGSQMATVDVPDTGDWQEWTTADGGSIRLTGGTHTIRLTANGDDFNLNWFALE